MKKVIYGRRISNLAQLQAFCRDAEAHINAHVGRKTDPSVVLMEQMLYEVVRTRLTDGSEVYDIEISS